MRINFIYVLYTNITLMMIRIFKHITGHSAVSQLPFILLITKTAILVVFSILQCRRRYSPEQIYSLQLSILKGKLTKK